MCYPLSELTHPHIREGIQVFPILVLVPADLPGETSARDRLQADSRNLLKFYTRASFPASVKWLTLTRPHPREKV